MMMQQVLKKVPKIPFGSFIEHMGEGIMSGVKEVGMMSEFFWTTFRWTFHLPFRFMEIVKQVEFIGNKSVFIICLTSLFSGMVFALQTYNAFHMFRAEALIGSSVSITLARELGPVLCALIVTGRAGAAMSAQLGTMRVTEQIDALEVMGVNPVQYLVVPRVIAALIAMPLLASIFVVVGNLGAYFLATRNLNIDGAVYINHMNNWIKPRDVLQCNLKAIFFALIFSIVGTYKGFNTSGGARGVGRATNETVVLSSILILVSDYFLSTFIRGIWYRE